MAWTVPRDWVNLEVVSHTTMNVHVRDNLQYIKDILDGVQGNQDVILSHASTDTVAQPLRFRKARGTISSPTSVAALDTVMDLTTHAYNAGAYRNAALIQSLVTAVAGTYVTSALDFYTYEASAGTAQRGLRISSGVGQLSDGAVGLPALTFANDTDGGVYRIGSDNWAATVGGTKIMEFLKSGAIVDATFSGAVNVLGSADDVQLFLRGHTTQTNPILHIGNSAGNQRFQVYADGNIGLRSDALSVNFGNAVGVFHLGNIATAPTVAIASGGILYVQAGSLKYCGSGATVTTLAPP